MKKPIFNLVQILTLFFIIICNRTFAQTGQKGSDYPTITTKNLAVIVIDFPDTPKSIKDQYFPTIAALKDTIFNGSIKKYFTDMSFGQFTLTGDVFGYFTHQNAGFVPGGYTDITDILTINTINISGFDINKYDGFAILPITDVPCSTAKYDNIEFLINGKLVKKDLIYVPINIGYWDRDPIKNPNLVNSMIGSSGYVIPTGDNTSIDDGNDGTNGTTKINLTQFDVTFSHELCHFLGCTHANSRTNGSLFDYEAEVPNNNCLCYGSNNALGSLLLREYGNWFDLMGGNYWGKSLTMAFRDYFGWTNSSNRYSIKDYGHFSTTIYPTNNLSGIRTVEIRTPYRYDINDRKNKGYFLEVKSGNYKWDKMLLHPQLQGNNDGVMVSKIVGYHTELLDMSPSPNFKIFNMIYPDIRDVVIKPGMVYNSKELKLGNVRKNTDGSFSIDIDILISKVNLNDSLALVALYNQCNGKNWTKKSNWIVGRVETWEGISVDYDRVTKVDLANIGLTGEVPSEISNLVELTDLNLSSNQLTGNLPSSLSTLVNLQQLNVYNNQITGFPTISAMSKLKYLNIRSNRLDFKDIEQCLDSPSLKGSGSEFIYDFQALVGKQEKIIKNLGEEFRISIIVGGKSNKYQWYKNGNIISGATQLEYIIPAIVKGDAAEYTCKITNTIATQLTLESNPITLQIMDPVANAGAISGISTVCQGQSSLVYSVPTIENATSYIWTLPTGTTGTSTSNSITVNYGASAVSGNITVKGHNDSGDGISSILVITVNPLPATAPSISGLAAVCQGQSNQTYTVPVIAKATSYIWTLPTGATGTSSTNGITVNFSASAVSGNITCKGHNDCGDGNASTLPIVVNPIPVTPIITQNGKVLSSNATSGNQWYNQNNPINGATYQDYTITSIGEYIVQVTQKGCVSAPSNMIKDVVTSITSLEYNEKIKVYPNPVSDDLTIEYKGNTEEIKFGIYSSTGQLVTSGLLLECAVVHTSSFPSGLYTIKFNTGKTYDFRKVIKHN